MLSPYRVLDLTDEKGAARRLLLAQLGAEVIAVAPPGGTATRAELDEAVAAWSTGRDPAEAQEELQRLGVAAHQVQHSTECLTDPQLAHRRHFLPVPHPVHGRVWVEGCHVGFSRTPGGPAWAGPTLGQHTDDVLRDLLG
jgi:crotonobetainyl-CoA:carnitine CoA-transferase CaiB-like acyl-CoA transferase